MASKLASIALRNAIRSYAGFLAVGGASEDVRHLCGAPIPTGGINFEYFTFDKSNPYRIPVTRASRTDPIGKVLDYGGAPANGSTKHHKATTEHPLKLSDGTVISDKLILADLRSKAQMGTNQLNLERYQEVLTAVNAGAGTATIDLTSGSTEAVLLLQNQVKAVMLACGGTAANCRIHLLWGPDAFLNYANHAKVQGRIAGGATKDSPSTVSLDLKDIDRIIGLNTVSKLSTTVYETGKMGQASSLAFMLSNVVYVAAVSMTVNERDPSAVKLFQLTSGDGEIVDPVFWDHPNETVGYGTWAWEQEVVVTNAGALKKITMTIP